MWNTGIQSERKERGKVKQTESEKERERERERNILILDKRKHGLVLPCRSMS